MIQNSVLAISTRGMIWLFFFQKSRNIVVVDWGVGASKYGVRVDSRDSVTRRVFFLIGGYWLLGVRSIKTLLVASVPFAVFLWFALAKLLDIYLAPGKLFASLMGG